MSSSSELIVSHQLRVVIGLFQVEITRNKLVTNSLNLADP
ncbi:hypothetical protein SALBM217S_03881 [Streptomyces griseoloalbus]